MSKTQFPVPSDTDHQGTFLVLTHTKKHDQIHVTTTRSASATFEAVNAAQQGVRTTVWIQIAEFAKGGDEL